MSELGEQLLGPTYPYYKNVKTPSEIGMSVKGTLETTAKDVDGLIAYVEMLVSGKSKASATGNPLGNKYFLKTGAKCYDKEKKEIVDRYIYVNNVPEGNVPFISSAMGVNFSEFKGLIPGAISNMNTLNPYAIMQGFTMGATPDCQTITMQTINSDNIKSQESHYVATVDIKGMDPCSFQDRKNPLTGEKCRETFTNYTDTKYDDNMIKLPKDPMVQLYFASLACLGIYGIYRFVNKYK